MEHLPLTLFVVLINYRSKSLASKVMFFADDAIVHTEITYEDDVRYYL